MTISLGTVTEDARCLDKSFSGTDYSGTLRNECSVQNPSVLIRASATAIAGCNYMQISAFGRYYFITDITAVAENLTMVSGRCDVLKTYAEGIRSNNCILKRSSNVNDPWINDGSYVMKSQMNTTYLPFPAHFTNADTIILVTV